MEHSGNNNTETRKKGLWGIIDSIEGDKVIWIIVLLLILISVLAVFSSTSMIYREDRMALMKEHCLFALLGLAMIFVMYKWIRWIGLYRFLSQFGFFITLILLAILNSGIDTSFIKAETINGATRTLAVFGKQIHVFEIAKVAMVMYLAWALHSYRQDREAMEEGRPSTTFSLANWISGKKNFKFMKKPFWKRCFYIYLPSLVVCGMVALGSNSSAIFIGIVLIATMLIGGIPFKELILPVASLVAVAGLLFGIYKLSGEKFMTRSIQTFEGRLTANYDPSQLDDPNLTQKERYEILDKIRQPNGAKIAVHEGGILGKGSGNSTQKYAVANIYSDYMYCFLIEEYGLIGGIIVILLYLSLIARSSTVVRLCSNDFAKIAVGGLAFLITGQAFLHILVNVDIGPMTGQTLPLISHGASAFLVFCLAFGIILSISRMAAGKKMKTIEESNLTTTAEIQEQINILGETSDETI